MDNKEFVEAIKDVFKDCIKIVEVKNKDYAVESDPFRNFRSASVIGIRPDKAILVRILDKIARVNNLLDRDPFVKSESLEDTLNDIVNYAAILKVYRENEK